MMHPFFARQKKERNEYIYACQHCRKWMARDKTHCFDCLTGRRYKGAWRSSIYRLLALASILSGFPISTMLPKNWSFLAWFLVIGIFVIWSVVIKRLFALIF